MTACQGAGLHIASAAGTTACPGHTCKPERALGTRASPGYTCKPERALPQLQAQQRALGTHASLSTQALPAGPADSACQPGPHAAVPVPV